jgi:hypothetical protein
MRENVIRVQAARLGFALATMLAATVHASPAERACARTACRPQKQACAQAFRDAKREALVACEQLATHPIRSACRKEARHAADEGIRSCRASARECVTCCRTAGGPCPIAACGNGLIEGAEECDGTAHGACPGACRTDCTCEPVVPVCGNAVLEQGEQCDGTDDDACPDRCRGDCTCEPEPPTCGNGVLDLGEECDAEFADACDLGCTPECTCSPSICGDGFVTGDEQCEAMDDWACPGWCRDDCMCPPPVCGNGVLESGEECESTVDDGNCYGLHCLPDCTCADCGNGVIEAPVEMCEPADDAACPGTCSDHSCACLSATTDTCEAPREIDAFPFLDHQITLAATTSPGDPIITCALAINATEGPHDHSVWYALTAPASGLVSLDTEGSNYDTLLAVYTGTCDALGSLACNDDEGVDADHQARIAFPIVQGERYLIEAAAYHQGGAGELRFAADFRPCGDGVLDPDEQCDPGLPETCASGTCSPVCECLGSAADECTAAPVVTELPVDVRLSGHAATGTASDPLTCSQQPPEPPPSTWFRFVAPTDGTVVITTEGSDYDTVLALFTGECGTLSFVVCDDDGGVGRTSFIRADVSAGVTYTLVATPWFKTLPGRLGLTIAYVTE